MSEFWAKALFDYAAVESTELSVTQGELVFVQEQNDTGWCLARKESGDTGWLPTDYVEKVDDIEKEKAKSAPAAAPVVLEPEPEAEVVHAPAKPVEEVKVAKPSATSSAKPAASTPAASTPAAAKPVAVPAGGDGKSCAACGKRVDSAYVVAKEKTYHAECFKCHTCETGLGGKAFIEKDGFIYCENCYYESFNPKCGYCEEVIKGQYISALGKSWHPDHFVCTECGAPFEGSQFHKHEDKPYCEKHFNELFAENCAKCGKKIEGQVFEALDRKFHLDCFTCVVGEHQIGEGVQFHIHEERVYCPQHFEELFLQKCAGCNQIIKGQYVKVLDSHFHPQCWKCSDCGVVISSDNCGQAGGKFYCKNCVGKKGGSGASSGGAKAAATSVASKPAAAATSSTPTAAKETKDSKSSSAASAPPVEDKSSPGVFYTFDQLKSKDVPKGVDPANRELWLDDDAFFKVFGVGKKEWEKLPGWKKNRMKQKVGMNV